MRLFNKLKWVLIIPTLGVTIIMLYMEIKNKGLKIISNKKSFFYWSIYTITFFISVVVIAFIFRLINYVVDISDKFSLVVFISLFVASYIVAIPCYIFAKNFFEQLDKNNEVQIDYNNK